MVDLKPQYEIATYLAKSASALKSMDAAAGLVNEFFKAEAWTCEAELDELWDDLRPDVKKVLQRLVDPK